MTASDARAGNRDSFRLGTKLEISAVIDAVDARPFASNFAIGPHVWRASIVLPVALGLIVLECLAESQKIFLELRRECFEVSSGCLVCVGRRTFQH